MSFNPFPDDPNPYPAQVVDRPGAETLYRSATGFEKALADVDAERLLNIHAELIIAQWDPWAISYQNLPYLAWAMGSNLWEDIWTEGIKRGWTAEQWTYKSVRGAPAAYRMALKPSGYDVTDMLRPEQGLWVGPELTKEELDAWIHLMPELRIKFEHRHGLKYPDEFFIEEEYPYGLPLPPGFDVAGDPTHHIANIGFLDDEYFSLNDGPVLRGRQAIIRHRGVDETVYTIDFHYDATDRATTDYERYSTIGKSTLGLFIGNYYGEDRFICAQEVEPKIFTIRLDRNYVHDQSAYGLTTIVPDLTPLTPRYERNSDIGWGNSFFFLDDFALPYYLGNPDGGGELLADRIYLLDPDVIEPMNQGVSFIDWSRIGIPSYYAEVQVDLHGIEHARALIIDTSFIEEAFVVPTDLSHIERAFRAIVDAKALRDTIAVSFAPKRPAVMGDRLPDEARYADWIAEPL
jgi:phage tail P2-like protein